jgi:hypothetical protein
MNSPSLSHSYISNSVVTNSSTSSTTNNNNNNNNNGYTRERSNTKSNHVQFLKLNEKNYLNGSSNIEDDSLYSSPSKTYNSSFSSTNSTINTKKLTEPVPIKETTINNKSKINKTDNEPVNDLLFKPKTSTVYDSRIPAKSNEKLDLIQQQQREQMLLQSLSTTPNSSTNPSLNEIFSSTNNNNNNDNNNTVASNTPNTTTTNNNNNNNSEQMNDFNGADYNMEKPLKKLPFYSEPDTCIGFSWSWNFMLGRKWRSQFTGDELFQDNILADFRIFCSNKNGRLAKFYNECKDTLD